jgi:methylamine---glutamate N-methyltransferase subunit C
MPEDIIKEIQKRVEKVPIAGGRSNKLGRISFEDLVFVPAQLAKRPVDYYREKIEAKTIIGKLSKKPIELETPIIIGAMSFGALNRETKTILALASALALTAENTGEGGMAEEEREYSKYLIGQYSTGRFGINEEYFQKADAIEIKIGQGAKPGAGGFLPGFKVTEEIAKIRNVAIGRDIHSPASHPDIKNIDDLKRRVQELREKIQGKPIILKLGACEAEDIRLAIEVNPDVIAVDGMEGGTGGSAQVLLDEMGIPTIPTLVQARKVLNDAGSKIELWAGGGLNKGGDIAKAMALGADAVFLATALIIAIGAQVVLSLTDQELKEKLVKERGVKPEIAERAVKVANFIKNCTEEIKLVAGACGKNNVHDLRSDDLRALTLDMAKIARVKLVGE